MFGRNVKGRTLTFGVSGLLRQSNLVMWDHETESWWQQGTSEAIVGELAGTPLEVLPAQVVTWRDFKTAHPRGTTISVGDDSPHGFNPYAYYDTNRVPFLFRGRIDPRLSPVERVVGVQLEGHTRAYPFQALAQAGVVQETLGSRPIVIFYEPTALSALDAPSVEYARAVGSVAVFLAQVEGKQLTFAPAGDRGFFRDKETGSLWNLLGQAVQGPLKGKRLGPLFHTQSFWFYWAAIHPETAVYERGQ